MAKTNLRKVMALLIAAVFVGTSLPAAIPTAEAAEKTVTLFSDAFETRGTSSSVAVDDSIWEMYATGETEISRRTFGEGYGARFKAQAGNTAEMYIEPKSFPDGLVKKDKIVIKYDVNLECDEKGYHALKLLAGTSGEAQQILRIYRYQTGTTSYRVYAGSTGTPGTKMKHGTTYTITVTIDLTQEKDFCFNVMQGSTAVATYEGTLEEAMGSEWATAYKENGFSKIRWSLVPVVNTSTTTFTGSSFFDNISVTTTEEVIDSIDVNVSGTAKVGETLTATVTPANADVTYQWYRYDTKYNGQSSGTPIDGATSNTHVITTDDENHYIAVTATLKSDSNVTDTSATNDKATFVEAYPWVVDFNILTNKSFDDTETKNVPAAGIRYTRSQEANTITISTGRDGSNAVELSTADGTNSNTDIRTYYQWAYLNEGIIKYTMDVKIPQELNNTSFNLRLGSTEDSGSVSNNFVLGIEDEKYPIDEWFTVQVTLYPETATYDCEFYLANSDVIVIAQGAEIAEKNEAFAGQIKTKGLTNARITLTAKEDAEFTEAESVIIDNIAVDVLENKINVPYIVIDEETNTATATLTADEVGAKIFLALYDSNGNIKGIYLSDAATAESKALTATSLIALPRGGSAKAFLWNSDTLVPLRAISVK